MGGKPYTAEEIAEGQRLYDTGLTVRQVEIKLRGKGSKALHRHLLTRLNKGRPRGLGRGINNRGYVRCYIRDDDPMSVMAYHIHGHPYILEHRLVMARHLGRPLKRNETIHHINGDKTDNRLENLQLRQGRHGSGVVMRCRCCGSNDIEIIEITSHEKEMP